MNSTFTWAMPNKSISVLPITKKNYFKLFHCYKILCKIIDCVWPAPRILYQWNSLKYIFLKFYVMGRTEIDLFGIAHVKVEFIPVLKIYTIPILGRFVWGTNFVKCVPLYMKLCWVDRCIMMKYDRFYSVFGRICRWTCEFFIHLAILIF